MSVSASGVPVANIVPAAPDQMQRAQMEALAVQDKAFLAQTKHHDAIDAAIKNAEMAYRMQSLTPDVLNLDKESQATRELYGLNSQNEHQRAYGLQCLRARRLVESGVRFVEITPPNLYGGNNGTWDQHDKLREGHQTNALVTDQAVTALIRDLKSRGLLKETLILWAGEFGRTPDTGNGDGRDHHPFGFTIWLAGGGAKPGLIYGATDELGNHAVENVMTIHDLHATVLHLLGLDHKKLSYRFGGRDVTLPDVHGRLVPALLA
jgi:antitoxin (DNA-binding transcriptional repressor) of toxin-antitoxin stability system